MKKRKICAEYSEHIVCESWGGGGIDDVAFKAHSDEGYIYAHSCQDTHDKDVFHYIFQKDGSDKLACVPGACGMCGTEYSINLESMRITEDSCKTMPPWYADPLDIRLAPRTRDLLLAYRPGRRAAFAYIKKFGTRAPAATGARK